METVNDRWYRWYAWGMGGFAAILSILCVLSWIIAPLKFLHVTWGMSVFGLVLYLLTVAYVVFVYRPLTERNGRRSATLVLGMMNALILIDLIHRSGQLHSAYWALWGVFTLISAMFGMYSAVACAFLVTCYFLLVSTDAAGQTTYDVQGVIILIFCYIITLFSILIWRRQYLKNSNQQVNELNKLLKSKQLQSEALIQAIGDGVVIVDAEGKILLMNPAAASMTEWPTAEAIGINVRNVVTLNTEKGQPLSDEENPFLQVLKTKQVASQKVNLVGKSGAAHIVSLVISPVLQQGSDEIAAAVGVFRDVTAANAEEQRSADFISTASHEMRTPVAAIEGYLALALNEHVSKIDAKARDYLIKAHSSTQHLGTLFQDLLTSAKAEDGRLVSHPVVIEMGTYLEQLADTLKFAAQKKGLLTDFTIGASSAENKTVGGNKVVRPLYYVLADPDRMREVITNLFDNSVKYTESGKVSIGLTGNDKVVQLFVRDTGHGIPAEDIPHLFQKFYRVDNSATRTIGGTGLGLFICRKIIELYNGRIWVDSEFGKGSTFYINLPRLSSAKALELQQQAESGLSIPTTPSTPAPAPAAPETPTPAAT